MTKSLATTPPKLYMGAAAATLTSLCNAIDNGADLDETMTELFATTTQKLSDGVGRRKAAARAISGAIEQTKAYEKQVTSHRRKLEAALVKLKEMTKEIVEANPDIPFKDELGKKLTIVKNSKPSVSYDFDLGHKATRNILDGEALDTVLGDTPAYVERVQHYVLDTGKVLADLQAGADIPWATMSQSYHLRGLV